MRIQTPAARLSLRYAWCYAGAGVRRAGVGEDGQPRLSKSDTLGGKFGRNESCQANVHKAFGSWGRDCSRAFASQGIYLGVRLLLAPAGAVLDQVTPVIVPANGTDGPPGHNAFNITLRVTLRGGAAPSTVAVRVSTAWDSSANHTHIVQLPGGRPQTVSETVFELQARNVALWWPNGLGAAVLHNITVTLRDVTSDGSKATDTVLQTMVRAVGFRTFEFVGSVGNASTIPFRLFFRVNGLRVFAKGFDWMPIDALRADTPAQRSAIRARLGDLVAAQLHGNTVRIWGGGVYESDDFYDVCDQLGILVLQDSAFHGAPDFPSGVADFDTLVQAEAEYNARRIGGHPSLAVWTGKFGCTGQKSLMA